MGHLMILLIAIIVDFILGDPPSWPHPVRYIGRIIKRYEKLIRKKFVNLKVGGYFLTVFTLATVITIVSIIISLSYAIHSLAGYIASVYLTYTAIAGKCLDKEARKVYVALLHSDIQESRRLLSFLVGRQTENLTAEEIVRGSVETVAENTVDGVIAPLFYFIIGMLFNLPVHFILLYKAINTLDSMVGYIYEPYKDIGFASAKLDDIVNYIPARLGSILILASGGFQGYSLSNGIRILTRDRRNHKSPNCGYPESAVAGLLKVQLGGINTYFGNISVKPTIGEKLSELEPKHIVDTIKIMYGAEVILVAVIIGVKLTL